MTTLCIETATENGLVVVVGHDGALASVSWRSKGRHGENLFGQIESALAELGAERDELSLIGVDVGPGRFTSLRVGLATAKGIALGLGLPIVGVSSLRVLARSIEAPESTLRVPVMNAYRGDVFAAAYRAEGEALHELVPAAFGTPESVFGQIRERLADEPVAFGGEGVEPHAAVLKSIFGSALDLSNSAVTPSAGALAAEVRAEMSASGPSDLGSLEPQYLRPSDAKLPERPLRTEHSG